MPKLGKGRFAGKTRGDRSDEPAWEEIPRLSIADLRAIAQDYERRLVDVLDDASGDHPSWLKNRLRESSCHSIPLPGALTTASGGRSAQPL